MNQNQLGQEANCSKVYDTFSIKV